MKRLSKFSTLAAACLTLLFAGACSSTPAASSGGPTRTLAGLLTGDFSPGMALMFLTRGGRFRAAFPDATGSFFIQIPALESTGTLVLVDNEADPSEFRLIAQLVDGSGNGLFTFLPGTNDVLIGTPIDVEDTAGTMELDEPVPDLIEFVPGPYTDGMLCSDVQAASCPLSEVLSCDPGPCGLSIPAGTLIAKCDPCVGPFFIGVDFFTTGDLDLDQEPLPDVLAPYPGLAIRGAIVDVPPVQVGGVTLPATYIDLGREQPGMFLTDPDDPTSYRFTFENGERFSLDDFFAIELPGIPAGSKEKIIITYRTTLGTVITYRCAPDNTDAGC
ncbi:MAG: hypothetical protein AB1405_06025 [Bdellovibrionota bacterium]